MMAATQQAATPSCVAPETTEFLREERLRIVKSSFGQQLSSAEARHLRMLDWYLDRIADAQRDADMDVLEARITVLES